VRSPEDERNQSVFGSDAEWLELVRWLDRGNLILVPLRRRVTRRAIIAALGLLALVATIPFDIPNALRVRGAGNLEWNDIFVIVVVAVTPRLRVFKGWLLGETEKRFLQNLLDLETAFYRREVTPRIEIFNAVFDRKFAHVRGAASQEFSTILDELQALRARVDVLSAAYSPIPISSKPADPGAPSVLPGLVPEDKARITIGETDAPAQPE